MKSNQAVLDSFRDCPNMYHEWTADSWISLEAPFWIPTIVTCSLQATRKGRGFCFQQTAPLKAERCSNLLKSLEFWIPYDMTPKMRNHDNL